MKAISLILTLITVAIALAIVLGLAQIFVSGLIASQNIHLSTISFYVADAGIEAALYADRLGGGLADGFLCDDSTPRDSDTCLAMLDNQGSYTYTVQGTTPARTVRATGTFFGAKRSIEVNY